MDKKEKNYLINSLKKNLSLDEYLMLKHDIIPYRKPDSDTSFINHGSFGNVYEGIYHGYPVAVKIQGEGENEIKVWQRIQKINFTDEERRHIPVIYALIEDSDIITNNKYIKEAGSLESKVMIKSLDEFPGENLIDENNPKSINIKYQIIVMEKLEPMSMRLDDILFSPGKSSVFNYKRKFILKDEENLYNQLLKYKDVVDKDLNWRFSEFIKSGFITKENINKNLNIYINNIFKELINDKSLNNLENITEKNAELFFDKLIEDSSTIDEKEIKDFYLNKSFLIKNLLFAVRPLKSGTYFPGSAQSYDSSEDFFEELPETKSFMSCLFKLKENGIYWGDVYSSNIMQRPSTKDLVIIDVGAYRIKQTSINLRINELLKFSKGS